MDDIFDFYIDEVSKNGDIADSPQMYSNSLQNLLETLTSTEEEVEENVFVKIDNEMKCSEVDLFYISVENISEISNYKDLDGFYKIDVVFVDGRTIQFEYILESTMKKDYKVLLKYFKNENGESQQDDGDSDSDSDF
jgi:hypothetical protein